MTGTRFRLYPQYDEGMEAETITVSSPAGSLRPGPADRRMHVADPIHKLAPYDPPLSMPPVAGPQYPPAWPGPGGHFDHLPPRTPQFLAAHLFGTVRRTLDIWEYHLGRDIRWWHADEYPSLELVPLVAWSNAQSGPGFLETGIWPSGVGDWQPFALNHDIIAHECGHTVMFSVMGTPPLDALRPQFLAFHESFSDLVALIGALHFASVRRRLMAQTRGNLYVLNLVSRIGEVSGHQQIRIASNTRTMAEVADLSLNPDLSWHDPSGRGRNAHALAEPLTGAIFDVLVELYQEALVARRLIAPDDDARGWTRAEVDQAFARFDAAHAAAFARLSGGFLKCLNAARDAVARAMAYVIDTLPAEEVAFDTVAARLLEGLARQGNGPLLGRLIGHFTARGIDPGPALRFRPAPGRPDRVVPIAARRPACRCGDPGRITVTRRLMKHSHRGE
jgi:hypothetical protein